MAVPYQNLNSTRWQQYQDDLSPTQLQQPVGSAIEMALAVQKDYEVDRLRYSIKAKLPGLAPQDALALLGTERGLPQGLTESSAAYAARLRDAWNAWQFSGTAQGLLQVFSATGYMNVVVAQVRGGKQFTLDNGGTNLLTWSQFFGNTIWVKVASTTTLNALTAPDGTTTASKLVETATTNQHRVDQTSTLPAGNCVLSAWGKQAERSQLQMRVGLNGGGFTFDLSAGTVSGTSAGFTAGILSTGSGFYRCWIAGACALNDVVRLNILNAGVQSYAGDGTSGLYIWGSQVESVAAGVTTPSNYCLTSGNAKTSTLGSGAMLTSTMPCGLFETDPLSTYSPANQAAWGKFDVIFPLPLMAPNFTWSAGIPSSSSSESNFIRALIQAWKPAHSICDKIVIHQQGKLFGYPATQLWGSSGSLWGGSANTVWTP